MKRLIEQVDVVAYDARSKHYKAELQPNDPLVLNVGGKEFTTSISTLTSAPDSYFSILFGNNFNTVRLQRDGSLFIDRDPANFDLILGHLRGNDMSMRIAQLNAIERVQLIEEVQFYGLEKSMNYFEELKIHRDFLDLINQDFTTSFNVTMNNPASKSKRGRVILVSFSQPFVVFGIDIRLYIKVKKKGNGKPHQTKFTFLLENIYHVIELAVEFHLEYPLISNKSKTISDVVKETLIFKPNHTKNNILCCDTVFHECSFTMNLKIVDVTLIKTWDKLTRPPFELIPGNNQNNHLDV